MSDCLKILVIDHPSAIRPFDLDSNGRLFLDTDEEFNLRLSKGIEQLDLKNITIESVLGTSLPKTPKNDLILRKKILPNGVDVDYSAISIIIFTGSRVLRQTKLFIINYEASNRKRYEIEIRTSRDDHWIVGAKDLYIKDIPLGNLFTFDEANVEAFNLLGGYVDGDVGVRFPLAFYGAWLNNQGVALVDLRPYYFLLWILQEGFCKLGWKFRSPVWESPHNRRAICYLLDKNFGGDQNLIDSRRFNVRLTFPIWMFPPFNYGSVFPIPFDEVLEDPGGNWNPTTWRYSGAGVMDVYVKVKYRFHGSSTTIFNHNIKPVTLTTSLWMSHPTLGSVAIEEQFTNFTSAEYQDNQDYEITHEFVKRDVQVDPAFGSNTNGLFVASNYQDFLEAFDEADDGELVILEAQFWNVPKSVFLQSGDEVLLNNLIGSNYKFLDIIKGAVHPVRGMLKTKYLKKEVWLDTPFATKDHNDNDVEGFFDEVEDAIDLDDIKVFESERVITPNRNFKRYYTIKFLGDGDAAVKDLKLPDNSYLHSHTIDYGDEFPEEYEIDENPFFEPTLNRKVDGLSLNGEAVDMPWLVESLDNDPPTLSRELGPRILYWNGPSFLYNKHDPGALTPYGGILLRIFGSPTLLIPYAFQKANSQVVQVDDVYPIENFIYGDAENKKDLFNLYHKKWLYQFRDNLNVQSLFIIQKKHYFGYDFTRRFTFTVLGRKTSLRMIGIDDFALCTPDSTPILFLPEKKSSDPCLDPDPPGYNPCKFNNPQLIITLEDGCYIFSMGGVNYSPVGFVIFEYKYLNDLTWTTAPLLCNPTGPFDVRMSVNYVDGCPIVYRRKFIDPCGNSPEITFEYDYQNDCVTVIEGGINGVPIASVEITYSPDGGGTWLPYTNGSCVILTTPETIFQANFNYEGNCPQIIVTEVFNLPVNPPLCEEVTADVTCDNSGNLTLTGETVGNIMLDLVTYLLPGNTNWMIWDGVSPITPCPFQYRRVIIFCGNECPDYCGPIHICECVTCLVAVTIQLNDLGGGSFELQAIVTDCNNPIYSWEIDRDDGNGFVGLLDTDDTVDLTEYGTYKVFVECDDSCMAEAEYAYPEPPCVVPLGTPTNVFVCND